MAFEWLKKRAETLLTQDGLCSFLVWQNTTLKGTRTTLKLQDSATLSGMDAVYAFSVLVPYSETLKVNSMPSPRRDRVSVDGKTYLVLSVETDVAGNRRIHLGDEYN